MKFRISIAKALQMAGYATTSGYCGELKCYAVYAYHPNTPTSCMYTAKRLLDGSYTLYNAKGKLVYTLKEKECGKNILPHIKDISPKIKRTIFMDNFEFACLCSEAGLKIKDLRKMFGVPRVEAALWVEDDDTGDENEIPENVILRVQKQLAEVNKLKNDIIDMVMKQPKSKKILLMKYETQKELSRKSPQLISVEHHTQTLRGTLKQLEKEGYKCEIRGISPSYFEQTKAREVLKEVFLVMPVGYKDDTAIIL